MVFYCIPVYTVVFATIDRVGFISVYSWVIHGKQGELQEGMGRELSQYVRDSNC